MAEFSTRKHRLVREVECELAQLKRIAEVAKQLTTVPAGERRPWDAAAAAKYVADLILGLENLCKRRYRYLSLSFPGGPESHSELLEQFLADADLGGRLSHGVRERLKRYLRFRHRFSHGYGYEVTWDVVEEPLRLLPETVGLLADVWRQWLAQLPEDAD